MMVAMANLILIALAIGLHDVAGIGKSCPSSKWTYYKGTCYLVPQGPNHSWFAGRELCKSLGGDLVRPTSKDENDFVQQTMIASWDRVKHPNPWVRCIVTDQQRVCSEDPIQYSNWGPGLSDTGDCAVMIYNLGVWRGLDCNLERAIMCAANPDRCARSLSCSTRPQNEPLCLTNHSIAEFSIKSHMQCCVACSQDPTCRSFNLKGQMCQLNSATVAEAGVQYAKTLDGCAYYENKLV